MVAKSFQSLQILCEPYKKGSKNYVKVLTKSGTQKEVRWYSVKEYQSMYGEVPKEAQEEEARTDLERKKKILGFVKDFIYVLDNKNEEDDALRANPHTRFHKEFGWYIPSGIKFDGSVFPKLTTLYWKDVDLRRI